MPFVSSGGTIAPSGNPLAVIGRPVSITTYSGLTAAYDAIYRGQHNVRTVVDFTARNIAQLRIRTMRRVSERERRYERDHPLDVLLRRPSPVASRYRFVRDFVTDLLIYDLGFALKVTADGRNALVRYPAKYAEPVGSRFRPDGWRLLAEPGQPVWPAASVVAVAGYNPDGGALGVSPIETLRRILAEDIAAGEYREQFWARHARVASYISRPADAPRWTDGARERFEASFAAQWSGTGPGAGGTPILEDGMDLRPAVQTAVEAEYLGARKLTRAETAAAFHIPPSAVGVMEGETYSSLDAAHRALYQDAFGPLLTFLGEELVLQVLPDVATNPDDLDEIELDFAIEDKLRGSFVEEAEAMTRAVGGPWMTRAEGRVKAGLPPLPDDAGADDLIVPLNVTTGGRPNPLDTNLPTAGNLARGTKALPAAVSPWVDQTAAKVGDFVMARADGVIEALRDGATPGEALDLDDNGRSVAWDDDLGDLLYGLARELAVVASEPIADRFGITYDLDVAENFLRTNARIAAANYNAKTVAAIVDAYATPPTGGTRGRKELDEADLEEAPLDPLDLATTALLLAATTRAAAFAASRAVTVTNFARQDAASQAGAGAKVWRVTAAHPRPSHAAINGERVALDETFSNGGRWPGDPLLSTDETAGCTCVLDIEREL